MMARLFTGLLLTVLSATAASAYDRCPGRARDSCLSPRERYEHDLYRSGHFGPHVGPRRLYREQLDRRPLGRSAGSPRFREAYRASVSLPPAGQRPATVMRLDQVGPWLAGCAAIDGGAGHSATLRLVFRADGRLAAPARITYGAGKGMGAQETFARGLVDAISRCMPLPLGGGFEKAIAGRPFFIRFIGGANKG